MEHELECYRSDRPWVDRPMQVGPACLCDRLRAHGARVRADERTKAAGRADRAYWGFAAYRFPGLKPDILAAIREAE